MAIDSKEAEQHIREMEEELHAALDLLTLANADQNILRRLVGLIQMTRVDMKRWAEKDSIVFLKPLIRNCEKAVYYGWENAPGATLDLLSQTRENPGLERMLLAFLKVLGAQPDPKPEIIEAVEAKGLLTEAKPQPKRRGKNKNRT